MVDKVKLALRLDGEDLDEEVQDLISACHSDLKLSGVRNIKEDDALIIQATKTYAKAYFDLTNPDHDKLVTSYESLKRHLSLAEEYLIHEIKQDE